MNPTTLRTWWYDAIKSSTEASYELKESVMKMRANEVTNNVQVLIFELSKHHAASVKKRGRPLNQKEQKQTVKVYVDTWLATVEMAAKQRMKTDAQKSLEAKKAQDIADIEATLNGTPQGIFEEMGVITDEKITGDRSTSI